MAKHRGMHQSAFLGPIAILLCFRVPATLGYDLRYVLSHYFPCKYLSFIFGYD
jgi:hypothetical protein